MVCPLLLCRTVDDMGLTCNRYFTYFMTVSSLTILFLLWLYWLIAHRRLLPAIVMIGAFMLFALWLTGLIVVGIDLFGPSGSVTGACNLAVFNKNPQGQTIEVLAYLQQKNICESASAFTSLVYLFETWTNMPSRRSIMATGIRHGTHRDNVPIMGHDHGIPRLCPFIATRVALYYSAPNCRPSLRLSFVRSIPTRSDPTVEADTSRHGFWTSWSNAPTQGSTH